jgi:hypothetical protein
MTEKIITDRHSPDTVQFKAWVPKALRARFNDCCKSEGAPAAAVLRDLLSAYCAHVEGLGKSGKDDAHGQR